MEEAETAVSVDSNSWFADMGLNTSDSILDLFSSLLMGQFRLKLNPALFATLAL